MTDWDGGEICICVFLHGQIEGREGLAVIPEDGWMAWHRDSVSASGLLLVFQVFF